MKQDDLLALQESEKHLLETVIQLKKEIERLKAEKKRELETYQLAITSALIKPSIEVPHPFREFLNKNKLRIRKDCDSNLTIICDYY